MGRFILDTRGGYSRRRDRPHVIWMQSLPSPTVDRRSAMEEGEPSEETLQEYPDSQASPTGEDIDVVELGPMRCGLG